MSKKIDDKKTIVIVGGGSAGVAIARPLSKALSPETHNIVLVNPRPFSIILPASLRMVVSDESNLHDTNEGALVPYDKLFINGNGTFVQAAVTEVIQKPGEKRGKVKLSNGEEIEYDALVLATGAAWGGPLDFPEGDSEKVLKYIADRRDEFANAKDILLVGGGSVGIELAGEIKDIWPSKPVTIIQRDKQLLNSTYPDKYRSRIAAQIQERGVNLILGDSLELDDVPRTGAPEGLKTKNGKVIKADLVLRTYGSKPATSFLASLSSASPFLTPSGTVKVQSTLQVPGFPNIFAAGDIIEWKEQKQAAKIAYGHAPVVIKNVQAYLSGSDKLKEYKGSTELIIITNGKASGLAYLGFLWGIVLGPWFSAMMKSKTLMVGQARAAMTGN